MSIEITGLGESIATHVTLIFLLFGVHRQMLPQS